MDIENYKVRNSGCILLCNEYDKVRYNSLTSLMVISIFQNENALKAQQLLKIPAESTRRNWTFKDIKKKSNYREVCFKVRRPKQLKLNIYLSFIDFLSRLNT